MSKEAAAPGRLSHCPVCGLPMQVRVCGAGTELGYDFPAWERLCRHPAFGGPSTCLAGTLEPEDAVVDPVTGGCDAPAIRRSV